MIIKINDQAGGVRLDKFLAGANWPAPEKPSRGLIQKLIKQALIKVNRSAAEIDYRLKPGDKIEIKKISAPRRLKSRLGASEEKKLAIERLAETEDYLVINKPAGLAVHGGAGYTLADWLRGKYPKIKNVGDDPARPGIVHRLDKDVSGLMVIAKTAASFNHLKTQFQSRTITKEYTALVYGKIIKDSGTINFPIKRSKDGYKMAALPLTVKGEPTDLGRSAITEYRTLARFINYTLLKVKIITGRTHQIRVHLAALDHPIVGDSVYGTAKARTQNKKLGLNRIFLIADRLGFVDLNNNRKDYKIGLAEELKNILKMAK